ncbi:uncharacterized protein LOC131148363 [Malania oleifera]|uniref:uncharacterized protein LOC131148363 n=1 Tax=Malania oleifera TaxID=397392 RepID=UPI0025ADF2AA|nr:uncharacterized protein LOC131148363 [Malania oleifera]
MVQGEREMLKKFMHRFNTATLEIRHLDMGVTLAALTTTLHGQLSADMGELMARAQKYINLEEMKDTRGYRIEMKRKGNNWETGEPSRSTKRQETSTLLTNSKMRGHSSKFSTYTPLNAPCSDVLMHIRKKYYVSWGYLSRFIKKEDRQGEPREQNRLNGDEKEEQIIGKIAVIFGGSVSDKYSGGAHKRYAKQVLSTERGEPSNKGNKQDDVIIFDNGAEVGVQQPHDDALVLSLLVENYKVRRVLIDNGSSANIMFWLVLEGMKISKERLKPISTSLVGFGGDVVNPLGTVTLSVIDEEVTKLVQPKFVREVNYSEWLNNVVLVKNLNGKWRTCIDFTDLNKVCPKDSFPLPRIDRLVPNETKPFEVRVWCFDRKVSWVYGDTQRYRSEPRKNKGATRNGGPTDEEGNPNLDKKDSLPKEVCLLLRG